MPTPWSQNAYIEAYRFAAEAHVGQLHPGTEISYLMHLGFVSMELLAAEEQRTRRMRPIWKQYEPTSAAPRRGGGSATTSMISERGTRRRSSRRAMLSGEGDQAESCSGGSGLEVLELELEFEPVVVAPRLGVLVSWCLSRCRTQAITDDVD